MASVVNLSNGRKRIDFFGVTGKRFSIRIGIATAKEATDFRLSVERLTSVAIRNGVPDAETSKWLADLPAKVLAKLVESGIAKPVARADQVTAATFIESYVKDRTDAKPRTIINLKRAQTLLVEFLGTARMLSDVTEGDADEFWRFLLRKGLGQNTARRVCGRAKQFFRAAGRKRLIQGNPFGDLQCQVRGNPERDYFLSREDAQKVLDACPDAEWRAIVALSRYGGLRCPSEHLALKWEHIDFATGRMLVHSCKTEHHEGKATRSVPIFPELRPYLMDLYELQAERTPHVITRYRDTSANLRTQLHRIIKRAGLSPWPKVFHNLRATRQTELSHEYPIHVVCAWIGNSAAIAKKHYLQVTDADFDRAAGKSAAKTKQQVAERSGTKGIEQSEKPQNSPENAVFSEDFEVSLLPPPGLEPGIAV